MTHDNHPILGPAERLCQRVLGLRHPADLGPLIQVALYYSAFTALLWPGLVQSMWLRAGLYVLLVLLNFALTIGVMHLHVHRHIFKNKWQDRILEILLCFPSFLTSAEMYVFHLLNHHVTGNDQRDKSTTIHAEKGWAALRYWVTYWYIVKQHTLHVLRFACSGQVLRRYRLCMLFDLTVSVGAVWLLSDCFGVSMIYYWFIPFLITILSAGYFAWLTHGPAATPESPYKCVDTVNNYLNIFVFNFGYHTIHHKYPGIHWSDIPSKLGEMQECDPRYIVSYWVTLNSAWRIARPSAFAEPAFGAGWQTRLKQRQAAGRVRWRLLAYYAWI